MNLKNWNHVVRLALLLPLIAAAGCTGSDVLTPTTDSFELQVEIVNVPQGYRFGDGDNDRARFRMAQIEVRPDDPNAAAVLGPGNNMFLLKTPVGINYDVTPKTIWVPGANPPEFPPPLSTGTWRIISVQIDLINFRDAEAPLSNDTCANFIERYRTNEFDGSIFLQDFAPEFRFRIESGAENQYSLILDWGVFTQALQEAWPCDQCGTPDDPRWCLQDFASFRQDIFATRVPDFLTFE